ncbi:hypothetical protein NPIL_248441 [Nephila pilipes]|uniref:Uncharacterized protein n=1 Tax=Nephila pilipes TaxID=299642 RepID=A0A8X6QBB5_NEPPI|nr:hypothetical protein NPIL_248441 [Nephila pilipes]
MSTGFSPKLNIGCVEVVDTFCSALVLKLFPPSNRRWRWFRGRPGAAAASAGQGRIPLHGGRYGQDSTRRNRKHNDISVHEN